MLAIWLHCHCVTADQLVSDPPVSVAPANLLYTPGTHAKRSKYHFCVFNAIFMIFEFAYIFKTT